MTNPHTSGRTQNSLRTLQTGGGISVPTTLGGAPMVQTTPMTGKGKPIKAKLGKKKKKRAKISTSANGPKAIKSGAVGINAAMPPDGQMYT